MRRRTPFRFDGHRTRRDDLLVAEPPVLTPVASGPGELPDGATHLLGRLDSCLRALHAVGCELDEYVVVRRPTGLPIDEQVIRQLVDATRAVKRQLAGQQRILLGHAGPVRADRITAVDPALARGFATVAHVRGMLPSLRGSRKEGSTSRGQAAILVE